MNWNRVKALFLHSWYHFWHSKETQVDLIWFPLIQFLIFGLISTIIAANQPTIATSLLLGFLLWECVHIGQYSVTVSMLWEVWSRSFHSFFITPLSMTEWVVSQMISGLVKTSAVVAILAVCGEIFFHFSLLKLGWPLLIYFTILMGFAYATGIFITGIIIRYGTSVQSFAWGLIYIFQPISAIFYPLSALPVQVRWAGYLSPITYVMETARYQLHTGEVLWPYLGIGTAVCLIYLILSWLFLEKMQLYARKTGAFARLAGG